MKDKKMNVVTASTIRSLVEIANNKRIFKEDIVSLIKESGQFILIYFE